MTQRAMCGRLRAAEPLVGLDFAFEALDVANLGAGIVGFELPIILGDPLNLESYAKSWRICSCGKIVSDCDVA